jgi:sugar phosphate permease
VGTHTSVVAQHVGGGVAAPGLAAFGLYYMRQSRRTQQMLLVGFLVVAIAFYFLFYEEEESLEEVCPRAAPYTHTACLPVDTPSRVPPQWCVISCRDVAVAR